MQTSFMRLADLSEKLVIILGFGREGRAMYEVVKASVPTARIIVTDEVNVDVAEFHDIADAVAAATSEAVVIKSPGIPWHKPYVQELQKIGATMTSSTNIFFAEREHIKPGFVIGVTGTKGKSTSVSLLAQVLQAAGKQVVLAGNIGEPAIAHVNAPEETIFVLEMSSYQLADLVIAPYVALFLNLYEEHMDWHGDVARYHAAKMRIAEVQKKGDVLVYNDRFPQLVELAARVLSIAVPFVKRSEAVLDCLVLPGEHNRENAAGVVAVCDVLGVDREVVSKVFSTFQPLPHRLQDLGVHGGIRFINDSISTTPQSALAAIDVYKDSLSAIILGGHDRGYDFAQLAQRVKELGIRVYLLQNAEHLAQVLRSIDVAPIAISTFPEIIDDVLRHSKQGSTCLLSPASPSFGQFKNFVERGEQFMSAVHDIS